MRIRLCETWKCWKFASFFYSSNQNHKQMIAVLGDLHLGRIPYGKPGLASTILVQGAFMIKLATREGNSLSVLAGDVYDRPEISGPEASIRQTIQGQDLVGTIGGNHDSYRRARNGLRGASLAHSPHGCTPFPGGWATLDSGLLVGAVEWAPMSEAAAAWAGMVDEMGQQPSRYPIVMVGHQSIDGPGYTGLAGVSSSIELPRSTLSGTSVTLVVLGDYHCPRRDAVVYQGEEEGAVPFMYTGTTFSRFSNGRITWPRLAWVRRTYVDDPPSPRSNSEHWKLSLEQVLRDHEGARVDLIEYVERFRSYVGPVFRGFTSLPEIPRGSEERMYAAGMIFTSYSRPCLTGGPGLLEYGSVAISPLLSLCRPPMTGGGETPSFLVAISVPEADDEHLVVDFMGEVLMSVSPGSNHPAPVDIINSISNVCNVFDATCAVNLRCRPSQAAPWRDAISATPCIIHVVDTAISGADDPESGEVIVSGGDVSVGFSRWLSARLEDTPAMIPEGVDPERFSTLCRSALSLGQNASVDQLLSLVRPQT